MDSKYVFIFAHFQIFANCNRIFLHFPSHNALSWTASIGNDLHTLPIFNHQQPWPSENDIRTQHQRLGVWTRYIGRFFCFLMPDWRCHKPAAYLVPFGAVAFLNFDQTRVAFLNEGKIDIRSLWPATFRSGQRLLATSMYSIVIYSIVLLPAIVPLKKCKRFVFQFVSCAPRVYTIRVDWFKRKKDIESLNMNKQNI